MNPTTVQEKVLVIEGDKGFAEALSSSLSKEGYIVTVVNDGNEAVKSIIDVLPHLIVLNVNVPGQDGYSILQKKQAEPLLQKIPVYLVSTQGQPVNMRQVPEGSVSEFILMFQNDPGQIVNLANTRFGHKKDAAPIANPNQKTLLWVEDDKLIGTILEKKFTSSGFNLLHAKNGDEALVMLKDTVPNAIVLDLLLPGMNGFDILQKIRADERLKDVPAMILSNLSKPSDIEKGKMLGAKKFLVKAATSLDQIVAEVGSIAS